MPIISIYSQCKDAGLETITVGDDRLWAEATDVTDIIVGDVCVCLMLVHQWHLLHCRDLRWRHNTRAEWLFSILLLRFTIKRRISCLGIASEARGSVSAPVLHSVLSSLRHHTDLTTFSSTRTVTPVPSYHHHWSFLSISNKINRDFVCEEQVLGLIICMTS